MWWDKGNPRKCDEGRVFHESVMGGVFWESMMGEGYLEKGDGRRVLPESVMERGI